MKQRKVFFGVFIFSLAALLAVPGVMFLAQERPRDSGSGGFRGLTRTEAAVLQRRIRRNVFEVGVLESAQNVEIKCLIRGGGSILWLAPNGSLVKKGDKLIEFDTALLEEKINQQRISLVRAQGRIEEAEISRSSLTREASSTLSAAELEYEAAKVTYDAYFDKGGEYDTQIGLLDQRQLLAEKRLQTTMDRLAQAKAGPERISKQQRAQAYLELTEAKLKLETVNAQRRLLSQHTRRRRQAQLKHAIAKAQANLAKVQTETTSALSKAKTNVAALNEELKLDQARLKDLLKQLKSGVAVAPQDGMVVYATPTGSRAGGRSTIEVGAAVRERQIVLQIPNLNRLQVRVSVHETTLPRIKIGQPVRLRFDADVKRTLEGKVVSIANTPEPSSWWSGNVKEYAVIVSVEKPSPGLRLGMTAQAEILVEGM